MIRPDAVVALVRFMAGKTDGGQNTFFFPGRGISKEII